MAELQNDTNDAGSSPGVPPPPSEVKVRTMRSDIDGIVKAGGGLPQFKTVPVEGMELPKSRIGGLTPFIPRGASSADVRAASSSKFPIWIIALIVVVFALIIFFGWVIFIRK